MITNQEMAEAKARVERDYDRSMRRGKRFMDWCRYTGFGLGIFFLGNSILNSPTKTDIVYKVEKAERTLQYLEKEKKIVEVGIEYIPEGDEFLFNDYISQKSGDSERLDKMIESVGNSIEELRETQDYRDYRFDNAFFRFSPLIGLGALLFCLPVGVGGEELIQKRAEKRRVRRLKALNGEDVDLI